MNQTKIYDPGAQLEKGKIYSVNGTLCHWTDREFNCKMLYPKYIFTPLNGQSKKKDIALKPHQFSNVYEVGDKVRGRK